MNAIFATDCRFFATFRAVFLERKRENVETQGDYATFPDLFPTPGSEIAL